MVTGPMPRNPNATRPKANTAGASMSGTLVPGSGAPRPLVLTLNPMAINAAMVRPSQYAEKFPATRPDKMFSDAPPSFDDVTTSPTWRDSTEVKTLTSSGMIAPASVPQEMIKESFHH